MRLPLALLFAAATLSGCTPHDGEVSGDYLVYLSKGSSLNIQDIEDARLIDLGKQDNLDRFGLTPVDCRALAESDEGQRLPLVDYAADCTDGTDPIDTEWFWWLLYYPFYKKEGKIDPYRVEAILTSEHDLQLTVHMDVPKFGDLRFGWVVDPLFQPTQCTDNGDGTSTPEDVDGDWLANWSADEEGATLFNLNAGAYQISPSNSDDYWYIEQDWLGGYSFGRFEDDDFYGHATDYVDQYNLPLYTWTYDGGGAGNLPQSNGDYDGWVDRVRERFTLSEENPGDLATLGKTTFPIDVKVEDNGWRISDEEVQAESSSNAAYGLENWVGVNTSWVKVDITPEQIGALETGRQDTPLTGSFLISLDGLASASKLFVQGEFTIDHIRADTWSYGTTLDQIKREENNTPKCGENRTNLE